MHIFRLSIVLVVLCLACAPVWGQSPVPTDSEEEREALASIEQASEAYQTLARAVNPAVVQVLASRYTGLAPGNEATRLSERLSTGSGVFLDGEGYIVTNAHVVVGARRVRVMLAPGPRGAPGEQSILRPRGDILNAEVMGLDQETDLALLKVDGQNFPHLSLGNSDELRPGQLVFAFGSPLGLENSVSMGVVSATARQLRAEDPMIYVQTDAPINPGNSGGPLVNTRGEVVGINTLNLSQSGGSEGLGFAAPSNIVETVYRQIRANGYVQRGVIGVHAQTLTPELARGLGIDDPYRVILADVYPNSPAAAAGLQPGDVVVRVEDKVMENARQFDVNLYGFPIGSELDLEIVRDGQRMTRRVSTVERNDGNQRFARMANPEDHLIDRLGILALPLDREVRAMLPQIRFSEGALVAASSENPGPWGDDFRPGDIIYVLNGTRIRDVLSLQRVARLLPEGRPVVAHVQRQGRLVYLTISAD